MRKRLRITLGAAVAGVLAAPATALGVHVIHPRNEDGYLAYLEQYGDPDSDRQRPGSFMLGARFWFSDQSG
jgi:hypothetical protein